MGTHFTDSPIINQVPNPPAVLGRQQRVQVLRTVPQMKFSMAGPSQLNDSTVLRWLMSTVAGFKRAPLSFAKAGVFEFHVALRKAISKATRYIFIADQAFTSQEVMDWINARMRREVGWEGEGHTTAPSARE